MAWFRVNDSFQHSEKVLSIPRTARAAALGIWVLAGTWAASNETDGIVPKYVLSELGATPRLTRALVEARLWLDRGSAGIEFTNWAEYQPTAAELEDKRRKNAERQAKWRNRSALQTSDERVSNGVTDEVTNEDSNATPDPTRPDPLKETSNDVSLGETPKSKVARGSRVSESFAPSASDLEWAGTQHPNVNLTVETEKFKNYWETKPGQGGVKLDWGKTWRNWIITAAERAPAQIPERPQSKAEREVQAEIAAKNAWLAAHGITAADFERLKVEHGGAAAARDFVNREAASA